MNTESGQWRDRTTWGRAAQRAGRQIAVLTTEQKNRALHAIADELQAQAAKVLAANALDVDEGRRNGLSEALLDRLLLNEDRLNALADDTRRVAELPDPVGTRSEEHTSELQSRGHLVCRLLLEKKKRNQKRT